MTDGRPRPEPEVGIPDLSEQDIYEAMKEIPGYLDITPQDFREVYRLAFRVAVERLQREVQAQTIMTREVVSVRPDTPLVGVAETMGRTNVSGVPVVDEENRVVGVISERDFLKRLGAASPNFMSLVAVCLQTKGCVALPIKQQTARDLMSTPALTVRADTPVGEIAALFAARHINRVPVTGEDGRLLGIVSRGDLIRALKHGGAR